MGNIYLKLQECRVKLQEMNLKKSGKNKFADFKYYELSDFLPTINKLMLEHKLFSFINFTKEMAVLTFINAENLEEKVEFTSPLETLTIKGCNDIQNLGGVQTYLRRYLYMNAFEIVENDEFDAVSGKSELISDAQAKRLYAIGKGKDNAAIKDILKKYNFAKSNEVTKDKYDIICKEIEAL